MNGPRAVRTDALSAALSLSVPALLRSPAEFLKPITGYKRAAPSFIHLRFHTVFKKRAKVEERSQARAMGNAAKSAAARTPGGRIIANKVS